LIPVKVASRIRRHSYLMTDTAVAAPPLAPETSATAADRLGCPPPEQREVELPSFETLNRIARAMTARVTQGISPHAQFKPGSTGSRTCRARQAGRQSLRRWRRSMPRA
jgi:hypothetical protein